MLPDRKGAGQNLGLLHFPVDAWERRRDPNVMGRRCSHPKSRGVSLRSPALSLKNRTRGWTVDSAVEKAWLSKGPLEL